MLKLRNHIHIYYFANVQGQKCYYLKIKIKVKINEN